MTRLVITFFLSLCLLLLRGYDHQYAHANHNCTSYLLAGWHDDEAKVGISKEKNSRVVIESATTSEKYDNNLSATETEDDDEIVAVRRFVKITNYFTSFFYGLAFGNSGSRLHTRLPFCKHFSYTSCDINIAQCVIRV